MTSNRIEVTQKTCGYKYHGARPYSVFRWKHPRHVLNEIKWRYDLSKCRAHFIHRGMPGDTRIVDGSDIKDIDRSYLVLQGFPEDVYIPYHRIFMIEYDGEIVYEHYKRELVKKREIRLLCSLCADRLVTIILSIFP